MLQIPSNLKNDTDLAQHKDQILSMICQDNFVSMNPQMQN